MNIVFLGFPGSGKGTQSRLLSGKLGLVHISFGDIYWDEIAKKTVLGHEIADYLTTGRLVPDWLVLNTLKEKFASEKGGLMLDGFPRTTEQADALDSWLASRSSQVTAVFLLKITEAEAVKRAEGRRVCPGCGGIYNSLTCAPRMADICDTCGGTLKLREDDRPAVLKNRIMAYKDQTEPLIAYYRGNTEFFEIRADQPPKDVTIQIAAALKTLEKH